MYKKSVRLRPLYLYIQSVKIVTRWGYSLLLLLTLTRQPLAERERATRKSSYQHNLTNLYKQKTLTMLNHSQSRSKEEPDHRTNLEAWRSKIFQVCFPQFKKPSWHPSPAAYEAAPPVPGGPVPVERLSGRVSQPLGVPPSPSEWSQGKEILMI